jgi:serine/threonine-protein kinase TTK/MPS1
MVYALKKVALDRADSETLQGYVNEIELLRRMKGHDRVIQLIDHEVTYSRGRPKVLQMVSFSVIGNRFRPLTVSWGPADGMRGD